MGEQAQLRRAARSGRRLLRRAAPPGAFRWIELLDRAGSPQGEPGREGKVFALAGALGAIALGLATAYRRSGSEVREFVWALHRAFGAIDGEQSRSAPEMENFQPWLRARLEGESNCAPRLARLLFQFIDVVNERLTLRSYYRGDLRAIHARVLLVSPIQYLSHFGADGSGPGADEIERLCELTLRFWDHLGAQSLASLGSNRIAEPDPQGFGGFFGTSSEVAPPTEEQLCESLRDLNDQLRTLNVAELPGGMRGLGDQVTADIGEAIEFRLREGFWPEDFSLSPRDDSGGSRSWWRRMSRIFS